MFCLLDTVGVRKEPGEYVLGKIIPKPDVSSNSEAKNLWPIRLNKRVGVTLLGVLSC